MASGYSGGGPDFFAELSGRSVNPNSSNINLTQNPYRTTNPQQLSQIFLDQTPNHQITQQRPNNFASPTFMGKRTLADFQLHQQSLNPSFNNLLLRSVKPRIYQNSWPLEFNANNMISPELPSLSSQHRYGLPLLQNLRPNTINVNPQNLPYMRALQQQQNRSGVVPDSEKKMMNQLQELEKQLLDDNDDAVDDTVSVITSSNSEWSDTIQSIINSNTNSTTAIPVAPSPTSSCSSSSSTNSVLNCSKQILLEAASAISEGKFDSAAEILGRISQAPNPKGNSEHKLMSYMLSALKLRVNPLDNPLSVQELHSKEHMAGTHLLYEVSPCFRLSFTAANSAILDATLCISNAFHVIDFDIGQGTQYGYLLCALSERLNEKSATLKLTAVSENGEEERLRAIGDKLSQLGDRVGVSFKFNVMSCKLSELSRDSLAVDPDEVLVVNLAYKLYKMADESVSMENPRDELLRRVKGLGARVVTLVEQEMNGNTAPFMTRVNETCAYYGALLESMESSGVNENPERVKAIEEAVSRKMVNSVGCEGRDRVERCEVFGKWRARMGMAGFELKPMSQNDVESIKTRLGSVKRPNPGFSVKEENGGICLGWMGKTLTVASAWR